MALCTVLRGHTFDTVEQQTPTAALTIILEKHLTEEKNHCQSPLGALLHSSGWLQFHVFGLVLRKIRH